MIPVKPKIKVMIPVQLRNFVVDHVAVQRRLCEGGRQEKVPARAATRRAEQVDSHPHHPGR